MRRLAVAAACGDAMRSPSFTGVKGVASIGRRPGGIRSAGHDSGAGTLCDGVFRGGFDLHGALWECR
jgi:hypothetical protein